MKAKPMTKITVDVERAKKPKGMPVSLMAKGGKTAQEMPATAMRRGGKVKKAKGGMMSDKTGCK